MNIFTPLKKQLLLIAVAIALLSIGQTVYQRSQVAPETSSPAVMEREPAVTAPVDSLPESLVLSATADGQTALELLEQNADIETQDFGEAGAFVQSINGVAGDDTHYWAFYVNDEFAQQGVSQTVLSMGDTIRFEYASIDEAEF